MKVRELIKELTRFNPEWQILIEDLGSMLPLEKVRCDVWWDEENERSVPGVILKVDDGVDK